MNNSKTQTTRRIILVTGLLLSAGLGYALLKSNSGTIVDLFVSIAATLLPASLTVLWAGYLMHTESHADWVSTYHRQQEDVRKADSEKHQAQQAAKLADERNPAAETLVKEVETLSTNLNEARREINDLKSLARMQKIMVLLATKKFGDSNSDLLKHALAGLRGSGEKHNLLLQLHTLLNETFVSDADVEAANSVLERALALLNRTERTLNV